MPELIVNGKNGFLVNSAAEAVEAVSETKKIDRSCCRLHVEKYFTADRMVREYIEVYKKIISRNTAI
jgi:glycosyltransferase involved in cell wall biosynthesis